MKILPLKVNLLISLSTGHQGEQKLQYEVENLNSTKDGESSKESHGASNCADHVLKRNARVLANRVIGGCAEVDLDRLQWMIRQQYCLIPIPIVAGEVCCELNKQANWRFIVSIAIPIDGFT